MINSTNEQDEYVNEIKCIGKADFPFTLFFDMNGKVYEVVHIPTEKIEMICHLIIAQDKQLQAQPENQIKRIVITDKYDDFKSVHIVVVKHFCNTTT
jgi:adenine deaminase